MVRINSAVNVKQKQIYMNAIRM